MSTEPRILPAQLIQTVDEFAYCELADAAKYDNREPLDESGVHSLHRLAARIYAAGWDDGERAAASRASGERLRKSIVGGLG